MKIQQAYLRLSQHYLWYRKSNGVKVFFKIICLENFAKFAGKQLWRGVFSNKVSGLVTFLRKILQNKCFPVNLAIFLETRIMQNTCGRLVLLSRTYKYYFMRICQKTGERPKSGSKFFPFKTLLYRCSTEQLFRKLLRNSQENTCNRVL